MKRAIKFIAAAVVILATGGVHAMDWPIGYARCADEGEICRVGSKPRSVSFGIKGKWVVKTLTGDVKCAISSFRSDPYIGMAKKCAVGATTTTTSTSSSASPTETGAFGFGASVTGGAGGEVVRVSTRDELKKALCRSTSGGLCTDATPRIVEVTSVIDFTGSEGVGQTKGCHATDICNAGNKSEVTLQLNPLDTHCRGKPLFDASYDVAGVTKLLVGSNKTLIGIGANAGLKGKGLMLQGDVQNIIVRNLSFTDINQGLVFGGDAITVADSSRVWIDHNYFARIGRQAIVTGTGDYKGQADNVTISWNEFDGRNAYSAKCNGKHYWNLLFYGNGNVTFANNWLHDFTGRGPLIGYGQAFVQMVDNYFENGAWHALDTIGGSVRVLVEGNTYDHVAMPILRDYDPGYVFALTTQTQASASSCASAIGRTCATNVVIPQVSVDNFTSDSIVLGVAANLRAGLVAPGTSASRVRSNAGVGKL